MTEKLPLMLFGPEMVLFWAVSAFAIGACIGSFLNVCIWRIPRGESIVFPESHCPKCNHGLAWYENIPFFSWIVLRGRCRSCHEPISVRYLLVELLTAVMFAAAWLKIVKWHQPVWTFLPYAVMIMLVITTVFIDSRHFIIPDATTFPAMVFGLLFALFFPEYWWTESRLIAVCRAFGALLTGIMSFGVLSLFGRWVFKKEALGMGDVKYLGAVGACLGFFGMFYTVFFGSLFGSFLGLYYLLFRRRRRKSITFGPFLAFGTLVWIYFGEAILLWYLSFVKR
jgi:leader peptidase (prepilin peptidase)/N-methyltransferase